MSTQRGSPLVLRLVLSACLGVVGVSFAGAVGRGALWLELSLLTGLYLAVTWIVARTTRPRVVGLGTAQESGWFVTVDLAMLTAGLYLFDLLWTPFVALYVSTIMLNAVIFGGRRAVLTAAGAMALYAGATGLLAAGVLPARDPFVFDARPPNLPFALGVLAVVIVFSSAVATAAVVRNFSFRAVRDADRRFRAVFDAAADAIIVVEPETGRLVEANTSAVKRSGRTRGELLARTVWHHVPPEEQASIRALLQDGGEPSERSGEFTSRISPVGEAGTFQSSFRSLQIFGKRHVVVVVRDLTDRQRLEDAQRHHAEQLEEQVAERTRELRRANERLRELQEQLIDAEHLAAAGEVAGRVAHAINNPLTALRALIEMRQESDEPDRDGDQRILALVHRLGGITRGMLELSRSGHLELKWIEPGPVLDDVRAQLEVRCREQGVTLCTRIAPDAEKLCGDASMLAAALTAIAENAVDASPRGSEVELEFQLTDRGSALFSVADRGAGMDAETTRRALEPFFTTRPSGTGLGLAIARGIVRGHGGSIALRENPHGGSLVTVEIPARNRPTS